MCGPVCQSRGPRFAEFPVTELSEEPTAPAAPSLKTLNDGLRRPTKSSQSISLAAALKRAPNRPGRAARRFPPGS